MFRRVAHTVASAENNISDRKKYEDIFYEMMTDLRFLPNSPTLMNAGLPEGQLAACFVIPIEDSIESIYNAIKEAALITKSGGGVGQSFSRLRPNGSRVKTTGGVASGPVSFMRVFNESTNAIKQGGRRRGANMGILRCDHPSIMEFITCKQDITKITNFNISIGITDKFMSAVKKNKRYKLVDPRNKKPYKIDDKIQTLDAKTVYDAIVKNAWQTGEPGVIFLDTINRNHPIDKEIETVNVCGEQPLLPYESCTLGSINISKYYEPTTNSVNMTKLQEDIFHCVRFLDNVIDVNCYPLPNIKEATLQTRKIGLGIMGLADLFIKLKIPYNGKEALKIANHIWSFIHTKAHDASRKLVIESGRDVFPMHQFSKYEAPLRNACLTTIAPTGTLSIIAGCSSGIEPLFAVCFERNVMGGTKLIEINIEFQRLMAGKDISMEEIAKNNSIQNNKKIPKKVRDIFLTSHDINYEQHIGMQAIFQKYSDSAVSKTINLPTKATIEDVGNAFMLSYVKKCAGITVYRDNCRPHQVLTTGIGDKKLKRSVRVDGSTYKFQTFLGKLYVTINANNDNDVIEVICNIGKSGNDINAMTEAVGRLISVGLKFGVPVESIVKQLIAISGANVSWDKGKKFLSIPDAIAQALIDFIGHERVKDIIKSDICSQCGSENVELVGGCNVCHSCGYSKCG